MLLYGSETWKVAKATISKLQVFVNHCLQRILNIHWPEVISNEELWRRAEEITGYDDDDDDDDVYKMHGTYIKI